MSIALSVVIPAYNEASRLGSTLERVLAHLAARGGEAEVLVVDDGSTDGTAGVAAGYGVVVLQQPVNRGKGAALRRGVLASQGACVLVTDADLSTPIAELDHLEPYLAHAELVLGSRALADSRVLVHQPAYREWMGKLFNRLVRLLVVSGIGDTQCGFKLLDGAVARALFSHLTIERFAWDVELIWLARRAGYRIAEVGVEWRNSPDTRVHAFTDSWRMLVDLVRIRWRHRHLAPTALAAGAGAPQARSGR